MIEFLLVVSFMVLVGSGFVGVLAMSLRAIADDLETQRIFFTLAVACAAAFLAALVTGALSVLALWMF